MYKGKYSDLGNKTDAELERMEKRYENERDRIMDDCLSKQLSFDEYENSAKDVLEKLYFIAKYRKLKANPVIEYGKEWKGEMMMFTEFRKQCINGYFVDGDGYGYYATTDGKSNIIIIPSDVTEDIYRTDFTHVIWFNK